LPRHLGLRKYNWAESTDSIRAPSGRRGGKNLTLDGVEEAAEEDRRGLRAKRYPGHTILHGCEVDINARRRLEFPDKGPGSSSTSSLAFAEKRTRAGHGPDQLDGAGLRRGHAAPLGR